MLRPVLVSAASCLLLLAAAGCGTSGPGDTAAAPPAAPATPDSPQIAPFSAAVKADPESIDARLRLGMALGQAQRRTDAIEQFEAARQLSTSVRTLAPLAMAYASASRFEDARAVFRELLDLEPGNPQGIHNLATVELNLGHESEALELYRTAIELHPDYLLAHYHMAGVYKFYGRYDEAYDVYSKLLLLTARNEREMMAKADAIYQMASIELTRGEIERAEGRLASLLAQDPTHSSAHYARGQALVQLGRPEEAAREFENHMRLLSMQEPRAGTTTAR